MNMEWISVKDRLPEPDENVFIYATKWEAKGYVVGITRRYRYTDGRDVWVEPFPGFEPDYHITHWMPLPTPPKEAHP